MLFIENFGGKFFLKLATLFGVYLLSNVSVLMPLRTKSLISKFRPDIITKMLTQFQTCKVLFDKNYWLINLEKHVFQRNAAVWKCVKILQNCIWAKFYAGE